MGSGLKLLFGKSFYDEDAGFAGYLDNIAVYPYALSEEEILGSSKLPGDVTADGKVDHDDAAAIMRFLIENTAPADWKAGDLNGDGRLSAPDLTLLKRILLQ